MTTAVQELSPEHFAEIIADSAVDPGVAEARGYRTLYGSPEDRQELSEIGFTKTVFDRDETYPALLIPIHRATGEIIGHQIKPGIPRSVPTPDGKPRVIKYETPRGVPNHLDVPPYTQSKLADLKTPLWVTEGMKKVDALISQGRAAMGLTGVYNWRRKSGSLGDWEDVPLKGRDVVICFDADAKENRNVQQAMRRFGAWLESKGVTRVHYVIVPGDVNGTAVKGVDDFFAAGGTVEALGEIASRTPPGDGPKDASFTDAVLTETVCEEALEGRFCWSRGLGWMAWNGHVWNEVADTAPTEAVRVWVIEQFQATLGEQKKDPSRDISGAIAGWRSVLSKGRIKALVDLSRGVLEKDSNDFDADPDLMGVKNGYVDLRTGVLHDPDPDKLMTKCAGSDYVPGATHPLWTKALEALPPEVLPWYHDRIGQSATGYMTPDDLMIIAHGDGENGKSTVVSAIRVALGSYSVLMSDRVLMASPDAHPTELMDLRGARYALLEETPEARRLDVHRLKRVVGTPEITARRIKQDDVTFTATHTLFVNTNFKPVVTETDHGTWRRLALLAFPYTYRKPGQPLTGPLDRQGDPRIRDPRTHADPTFRRAVLAWIVNGARAWFERDRDMLPMPDRVRSDTDAWRADTDLILGFSRAMLRFVADGVTASRDMIDAFNAWIEGHHHKPWTEKTFASRFAAHDAVKAEGVEKRRMRIGGGNPVTAWVGVTLGDESPNQTNGPFDPQTPTDHPSPSVPDRVSVQGVQGDPVNFFSESLTRVTGLGCTPCTAQVNGVQGQSGHPSSADSEEQNGQEEGPTVHNPARIPDAHTESEDRPDALELVERLSPETRARIASRGDRLSDGTPFPGPHGPVEAPAPPPRPVGPPVPVEGPHGPVVGFDLETRGKDWRRAGDGFITLSGYGDRVEDSPEGLVAALRAGQTWVGANVLGFDLPVLARHAGLSLTDVWGRVRDVQLQAIQHDPPTSSQTTPGPGFKSYSVDALSERLLGEPKDPRGKALAAEFCTTPKCAHKTKCNGWENIPASDDRFRAYCADDVDREVRLHHAMPWTPYMEREMKVQTIMTQMTLNGFRVDLDHLSERLRQGEEKKASAVRELADRFGMPTHRTKVLKNGTERVTEFSSPLATTEGKEWLLGIYSKYGVKRPPLTDKGQLSTAAETLRTLADHPQCPQDLRRILTLMGVVTSSRTIFGTIRDHLVGDRVHPDAWPRQASGRWSITDPGLTVMGKRGALASERAVMIADPGESLIAIDLGQIDARVIAAHAQDPNYLAHFAPGEDLHTAIAVQIFGDAKYRQDAKALGHGANYGMQPKRMIADGHDPEKVMAFFKGREENYPRLIEWTNEVRSRGGAGELLDNGFGRNLRVDRDRAFTQPPAQIGQSGTRDMMAECLLDLVKAEPRVMSMLRAVVHDEIVLSVPTAEAEEIGREVVRIFEREWAPPGASIPVPVIADCSKAAPNWAACYEK